MKIPIWSGSDCVARGHWPFHEKQSHVSVRLREVKPFKNLHQKLVGHIIQEFSACRWIYKRPNCHSDLSTNDQRPKPSLKPQTSPGLARLVSLGVPGGSPKRDDDSKGEQFQN